MTTRSNDIGLIISTFALLVLQYVFVLASGYMAIFKQNAEAAIWLVLMALFCQQAYWQNIALMKARIEDRARARENRSER